jgi:hypothetical protein
MLFPRGDPGCDLGSVGVRSPLSRGATGESRVQGLAPVEFTFAILGGATVAAGARIGRQLIIFRKLCRNCDEKVYN